MAKKLTKQKQVKKRFSFNHRCVYALALCGLIYFQQTEYGQRILGKVIHQESAQQTTSSHQNNITTQPLLPNATCEQNLYQGVRPVIELEKMNTQAQELCFEGYAAKASFISKSNLYSAEYLTKARLSKKIERVNDFHEESQLPSDKRAELSDYKSSGFDRGHLAPSADMTTEKSQYESFSLANMVPQVPVHNQKLWSRVESKTRKLAQKYGEIYVVTMPVYQNMDGSMPSKMRTIGKNQVYIPQYMAKAIYVPKLNQATVLYSPNDTSSEVITMSLEQFRQIAKINVFPTLNQQVKNANADFYTKW